MTESCNSIIKKILIKSCDLIHNRDMITINSIICLEFSPIGNLWSSHLALRSFRPADKKVVKIAPPSSTGEVRITCLHAL